MSLPRYAEYKDSSAEWLGEVPIHWKLRRLGYFFEERREKVSDKDFPPLSVTKLGIVPQLETAAKSDDGDNRKKVVAGDFVINSRSDRKGSSGAAAQDGSVSLINTVLRPATHIDVAFAHHLLRSAPFQEEFYRYGKGIVADLWSTSFSEMRNIGLAMPDVAEQGLIAAFLDRETAKIDALIAEQEKLIALLAEKRRATISNAVTRGLDPDAPMKDSGVAWLGEVPAHWKVVQLRRVVEAFEQGWSPECEARRIEGDEWGVLKAGCVNGGIFDPSEHKALPPQLEPREGLAVRDGDVLMSRASGSPKLIGSVARLENPPPRLMLSDKIFRLKLSPQTAKDFFALAMKSTPLRAQIQQSIGGAEGLANNLPQAGIKEFWLALPPLNEQVEIVAHIAAESARVSALNHKVQIGIALLIERRAALIAAAVTGKVDVRATVAQTKAVA